MENAGGSQLPEVVIEAAARYLRESFVQVGAPYRHSERATNTLLQSHLFAKELLGSGPGDSAILGPSTSVLCKHLADAYALQLNPGDEIVVSQAGHEANIGPWMRLERRGFTIKKWMPDGPENPCPLESLKALLTERTRLVTFAHTSNLLGDVADVVSITRMAHDAGARVVVDGVAYAPHRPLETASWGVDWYVFSAYKVYAPHLAVLHGRRDAVDELHEGPNHFFLQRDPVMRFELGGVNHESAAGLAALRGYLEMFGGVRQAFERFASLEAPLIERVLDVFASSKKVRLVGPRTTRVPTFSFTCDVDYETLCRRLDERGIGVRYGHMYSYRLCEALGIDPARGVMRASLVHYNSAEEVARLSAALDELL